MSKLTTRSPRGAYEERLHSADEAAALVHERDTIALPILTGQPALFLSALAERPRFDDLSIFGGLLVEPYAVLGKPGVRFISGFYGPLERAMKSAGGCIDYLPADFLGWERYVHQAAPRVVASALAPMDDDGFLSFGLHAGASFDAFLAAARDPHRLAIGEVVSDMPRVLGFDDLGGHRIHISEIDVVVESDRKAYVLPKESVDSDDQQIARFVEELVADGSTLQIGIGGVPNNVAELLANGRKGDFGVHSEMLVDGIMHLARQGKISNRKGMFDGFSVATFAAGSRELYDWMHDNRDVRLLPVTQINDPAIIRKNRCMVSINGALAIDLSGQIMADTIGPRQYSGVGGHELFVVGARASEDGKSIICLRSTAVVGGQRVSTIVANPSHGSRVTTPRHHTQWVVTENGAANLAMRTDQERALALVELAHPDFRDALRQFAMSR